MHSINLKLNGLLGCYGNPDHNAGNRLAVLTVSVSTTYLAPFQLPGLDRVWTADERFKGKIKWASKPLVFPDNPSSHQNQDWIT